LETGSQTSRLLSALVSVLIVSSDAQAASLTLGCTGTVTTSNVPKEGVVPDPDKDNVSDYSVVVDLDRHAVFGFWFETPTTGMTAAQTALPITGASAIGIFYFVARRKRSAISESIYGSVDPITGVVSAMEIPERQRADHRMGFALQASAPTLGATALRLTKRTKSDELINTTPGELGTIQTLEASGVDPTGNEIV
jgi:hypothetical protein